MFHAGLEKGRFSSGRPSSLAKTLPPLKSTFSRVDMNALFYWRRGHPEKPRRTLKDVLPWRYTENKLHPTQKPIEAIRPLITAFSKPGDVVLDPFAGSGTTAIAARQIGRRYILIKKDTEYFRIAKKRLSKTQKQ